MTLFRTSRPFPRSPEAVFDAIRDPARLVRWWGPDGFTNTFERFEFREGGRWQFVMHGPDGSHHANRSEFVEIVPNARVRIRHVSPPHFVLTIALSRRGDGTLVSWEQAFDDPAVAERIRHIVVPANEQNLDRLGRELAAGGQPTVALRDETDGDADAITEVTVAAFETLTVSQHTEQFIVAALRAAQALAISLVAEVDGRVVGHIAFSPVTVSDGTRDWYGLGPVSVLPPYQRKGIGKALINEGLARLQALDARGCCLVGHPAYYRQFGFANTPALGVEGVPAEFFFALSFDGHTPRGTVRFHDAFQATGRADDLAPPPTRR